MLLRHLAVVVPIVIVTGLLAGPAVLGEAAAADTVLTLKGPPTVEKRFVQGGLGNGWSIPDAGGLVIWAPPFGKATYQWAMPPSIPPTGATLRMSVDVDAAPTSRFAPAMGIVGSLVEGGQVNVGTLAEPGQSNSAKATVRLVPGSGTGLTVKVGIQDGPTYTYTYVAKPAGTATVTLGYGIFAPGRELSAGHVAVGTKIQLVAKATPAIPAGATLQILDKPQGDPLAPKSGYLIRTCTGQPCTVGRIESKIPRVHAYRAFVVLGSVLTPGYKSLAKSNPVVIYWDEPHVPVELLVQTTNGGLFEPSGTVPAGAQVTVRADAKAPLPPGTRIQITWELAPGGYGGTVRTCTTSPCIGTKYYKLPATVTFQARVVRGVGKSKPLGESKVVRVVWTSR